MFVKEGYQPVPVAKSETKRGTSDATYGYYTMGKLMLLKWRRLPGEARRGVPTPELSRLLHQTGPAPAAAHSPGDARRHRPRLRSMTSRRASARLRPRGGLRRGKLDIPSSELAVGQGDRNRAGHEEDRQIGRASLSRTAPEPRESSGTARYSRPSLPKATPRRRLRRDTGDRTHADDRERGPSPARPRGNGKTGGADGPREHCQIDGQERDGADFRPPGPLRRQQRQRAEQPGHHQQRRHRRAHRHHHQRPRDQPMPRHRARDNEIDEPAVHVAGRLGRCVDRELDEHHDDQRLEEPERAHAGERRERGAKGALYERRRHPPSRLK